MVHRIGLTINGFELKITSGCWKPGIQE